MPVLANLTREERVGLGVAVAAHVALVAALVLQPGKRDAMAIPERMSVSLADEVSLESTAPEPSAEPAAAIAPVLAPEPEPVVEPQPKVVERPVPKPIDRIIAQKPKPQPTKAAAPKPKTGGGSRIGDDFLKGTSDGDRSSDRGTPAAKFGAAEAASLRSAISRQLRPKWNAPQGVDADKLVTMLDWDLNPDGSLAGRPRLRSQSGLTESNRPQAARHVELAIRAVQLAAPFDLPKEYYDQWKRIRNWRFDRNTSQ
ncbi:MAG TPA: energy transducer TonB [Croceibacterium sp.]|nr:energy transducer TonB [Croceibacterium sp.]